MQLVADVDFHLHITRVLERNHSYIQHRKTSVYEDTKTSVQIRQSAVTVSEFSEQNFEERIVNKSTTQTIAHLSKYVFHYQLSNENVTVCASSVLRSFKN